MKLPRAVLAASLMATLVVSRVHQVRADPSEVGTWSQPRHVGVSGVHAVLLHTGKVLLYSSPEGGPGSKARLYDPVDGRVEDVTVPFARDVFCSAPSVMPDGRVLVAGGEVDPLAALDDLDPPDALPGHRYVLIFDPVTQMWSKAQSMAYARYYPSLAELPDGRMLVLSGTDENGDLVDRLEAFDPSSGQWSTLPPSADAWSRLYPRLALLPDGTLFRAGEDRLGRLFDPVTNTWTDVDAMGYDVRRYGGVVLLPGLTRVLTAGGASDDLTATRSAEVIDMASPSPKWAFTGSMHVGRANLNLVLLPDGTVLAVGGGRWDLYGFGVKSAELYDPATERWKVMASQRVQRTYHSTALLLPDGRVLSAGTDLGLRSETVELYSPPYLFRGERPAISSAPDALTYGQAFTIDTAQAGEISRVALVRPGATTHAANFDQRYVDLAFSPGARSLTAAAPADAAQAPPGYYMLFILNEAGVPSVATFVHLDRAPVGEHGIR